MHIRYNNTNKYWEKSTDMSTWTFVEESFPFDADIRFGSASAADIIGTSSLRYFTFDGQTKSALLNIGMTQAGTAGALVGSIYFYNRSVVAADKRICGWNVITDGAVNSGRLDLFTWNAGVASALLSVRANTDVSIGIGSIAVGANVGHLYIPSCAGTPTGTPAGITGFIPLVYDRTNHILYAYSGGSWRTH